MSPAHDHQQDGGVASTVVTVHPTTNRARQLPLPWPFTADAAADRQTPEETPRLTIFTIGHSNHDMESFLALLRQHGLGTLVDVRSAPYSRYAPHFSRGALEALLDDAGIQYVWVGDTLGGRPADPACYRDRIVRKGNVDYRAMARQTPYQDGVRQLLTRAAAGSTVVMCSEEDPRRCHRHHLIEHSLREHGVSVQHIRRDGSLEAIEPAETAPSSPPTAQLALQGIDA